MKVAASDQIHQIAAPSVAIAALDGPVTIESCSDKGGFSVLSSGAVQIKSGSSSLVMTGNGDRGDIHIDPGQGGDVLVFSGTETESTHLGVRSGHFEVNTVGSNQDALVSVEPGQVSFRIGLPGVGSSILMTEDTISFQVAGVELKISKDGIQAKTAGAQFELTQTAIHERAGISSRESSSDGHILSSAESRFSIEPGKITQQGIQVCRRGDFKVADEGAMDTVSAQATLTARAVQALIQ